jgi:hypothetical protein
MKERPSGRRQRPGGAARQQRRARAADTETSREEAGQRVRRLFNKLQAVQAAARQAEAKTQEDKNGDGGANRAAQKLKDLWQKLHQTVKRRPPEQ